MRAIRFNHVSIHAVDMDESLRFYTEVLGMKRLPSPDFDIHVEWLRLGDQQLHLFARETAAPPYHHIGLDVDDFEAAFVMARDRGLLDAASGPPVRELNDGSAQMYLRDPAGNLVELDWPDASTIDRDIVGEIALLADERPQSPEALRARLYAPPPAAGKDFP
jgi:catechol 2,3-dioxygenase-like lactoylglutathione lyase family enzyme